MTDTQNKNGSTGLAEHHWRQLEESGISPEVAQARGYYTATDKRELERLGFSKAQRQVPALVMPRCSPTGDDIPPQMKADDPRTDKNGKPQKYETPYKSKIGLGIHPSHVEHMRDTSVRLWITEGEKKGDSLVSCGECAVVLQGVHCWQRKGVPLPEWEDIKLQGREVIVAFDSDVTTNPKVGKALEGLVRFLDSRGAVVKIVYLPGPEKGVDDYLVAGHSVEDVLAQAEDKLRKARPLTITAEELVEMEMAPPKEAIPGIAPEGVTILGSKPKIGKTWMALGFGVAVAAGGCVFGQIPVEKGSALILALEDNNRRIQKRLKKMLGESPAPAGLEIATEWKRRDEGGLEDLREWLDDHPDARLIVIDTLKKIRPRGHDSRNIYDVDYEALEPLLPLAAEYGVAIIVIHHLRKTGAADPLDEISGSTGLTGGVDGVMVLKRERGTADATLYVDGRDIEEPEELALKWNSDVASWVVVGEAADARRSPARQEILDLLRGKGLLAPVEIAEALGKNRNTVRWLLSQMNGDEEVVAEGGKYKLPPPTPPTLLTTQTPPTGPTGGESVGTTTNTTNSPYLENSAELWGISEDVGDVGGVGGNKHPTSNPQHLSPTARTNASAVAPISVAEVAQQLGRHKSGPAKALEHYLVAPNEQRFEYLTCAVLVALGRDTDAWETYATVVEEAADDPENHPLSCECLGCV